MDVYWQQTAEQLEREGRLLFNACNQLSLYLGMPTSLWLYLTDVSRYWRLAAEGAAAYARDPKDLDAYEKYRYYRDKAYARLLELPSVFRRWEECLSAHQDHDGQRDQIDHDRQ
jgi:hypothetical protein